MKHYSFCMIIIVFLLVSCNGTKNGDFLEIPVNFGKNISSQLPLSEIAETITAIELELSDESLLNPKRGVMKRIILFEDYVFIAQPDKIFVFDINGQFVRSIGSKGQGPGEYFGIMSMAIDEINRRLYVSAYHKIICYDLDGNFLKETSMIKKGESEIAIKDINYINNEVWILAQSMKNEDENGLYNQVEIFRLNDDLHIIDRYTTQKIYERPRFFVSPVEDYILYLDSTVYYYYPNKALSPGFRNIRRPSVNQVLQDTLYRFKNNQLVPELKLKFKNNGIGGDGYLNIDLNIFRSSRYVFSEYIDYSSIDSNGFYASFCFCHDTKTGKGYNVRDGFTDDIQHIEKIAIRPFHTNPEMFYYWYTHMNPDDLEEPNPTLYIGKLKK